MESAGFSRLSGFGWSTVARIGRMLVTPSNFGRRMRIELSQFSRITLSCVSGICAEVNPIGA